MTVHGLASIARLNCRRERLPAAIPPQSEEQFQQAMIDFARSLGYRCLHQRDSRWTAPGWPDVVFCKPPRLIYAEFKREGGTLTPDQEWWLAALRDCGCEAYALWPSEKAAFARILAGGQ